MSRYRAPRKVCLNAWQVVAIAGALLLCPIVAHSAAGLRAPSDPELTGLAARIGERLQISDEERAWLVDKAQVAMTDDEHRSLRRRWLNLGLGGVFPKEQVLLYATLAAGSVVLLLLVIALLTIRRMRHQIAARRVAERDLQVRESRLRAAMEGTETGLWEWNPQTGEVYLDPVWFAMLGYTPDAMPADFAAFEALLHPDDRAAALESISAAVAERHERFEVEFRIRCGDGSYRWIHSKGRLLAADSQGNPSRLIGIHTDVTERKNVQEALGESEQRFRRIVEQSPVSIQIHGLDGKLIQSNAAYARLFALNDDVLEELYEKYNVREDGQAEALGVMPYIERVYAGEDVVFPRYEYDGVDTLITMDFRHPISRKCWIQTIGFPLRDEHGSVTSVVFMSEDITERRNTIEQLRRSEQRFRATFEQAAVGIAHVAPDGRFLRVNRKFCDILGYSHDQVRDLGFQAITHADDLEADLDQVRRLLGGQTDKYSMEKRYLHKRGHIIWANLTVSLVRDETGQPAFFVSVIEDISDRKQAETLLRQREAERDELLERLQKIARNVPGFIYQYRQCPDGGTQLDYVSGDLAAVYGVSAEQVAKDATAIFSAIHRDDIECFTASIARSAADLTEWHEEYRVVHPSGRMIWAEGRATPEKTEDDSIVWYGYQGDISRRKQQEQRLQQYQQRLKSLAAQLTLAEERERRHIAADLHDQVGQSLTLTRLQLAAARKGLPAEDPLTAQLGDISQSLLQAIQDTRHLIFELSSPALNELGLGAALTEWGEEQAASRPGLCVEMHDHTERLEIDGDLRAILFRSCKELITNVIKHAQAHTLSIWLEQEAGELVISVQDDGIGFDPASALQGVSAGGGFGLFSIQERMSDLGGGLELASASGAGCSAILRVPLKAQHAEAHP